MEDKGKHIFQRRYMTQSLPGMMNIILLISSLILIGSAAILIGFYRMTMLEVLNTDYLVIPIILVLVGIFSFIVALFGQLALMKQVPKLLRAHSVLLVLGIFFNICGIGSSVLLLFDIQEGFLNADVLTEISTYDTGSRVAYNWDTIQREYMCCGAYGGSGLAYLNWKHASIRGGKKSVPDSCCVEETKGCGQDLLAIPHIEDLIGKIHLLDCIDIIESKMESHVSTILMLYAGVSSLLGVVQFLASVLGKKVFRHISQY